MSLIPNQIIDEIRERADIVEVISEHTRIKKSGQYYKGLCPFHTEKTPSFTVNSEKRIYHCFGCGAGGNIFKFLMEFGGLTFVEAVQKLGYRYGVPIPENPSPNSRKNLDTSQRQFLMELNRRAADYFRNSLRDSKRGRQAREYLETRSFGREVQENYQLGWAPSAWQDLISYFADKDVTPVQLEKAGLIKRKNLSNSVDSYYDRFRGRIIFPLLDAQGNIAGFAGRLIVENNRESKYLNSPETALYKKSSQLFGFFSAREHIRKHDQVLVMEGYFDQIRSRASGIFNAVATCGTALTSKQVALLKNHTHNAVLIFDSDDAGQSATDRGFEIFLEHGMQVRVLSLPSGDDPDSFILKHGKDAFLKKLHNAPRFLEYYIQRAKNQGPIDSLHRKVEIINSTLPFLVKMTNSFEKREGFQLLVDQLQIEDRDLLAELKKTFEKNKTFLPPKGSKQIAPINMLESYLLHLMLSGRAIAETIRREIPIETYHEVSHRVVAEAFYAQIDNAEPIKVDQILDRLDSEEGKAFLTQLSMTPVEFDDPKQAAVDCICKIRKKKLEAKIKVLKQERREAENAGETERSRQLQQLVRKMQSTLNQEVLIAG